MNSASMDLLERLYRRLLEAAAGRDGFDRTPLTIADLYQHLIPYRGVRGELGILELAEYEHALVRLLAGEGGFLRLSDEDARQELAAELRAPNPILGIYRDYAGLRVDLVTALEGDAEHETAEADTVDDAWDRTVLEVSELVEDDLGQEPGGTSTAERVPLPEMEYPEPPPVYPDATRVATASPVPASHTSEAATETLCVACSQPLPDVEGLRYCPHCGGDQTDVPCERCGTPIRSSWNFCIRCGSRRPIASTSP